MFAMTASDLGEQATLLALTEVAPGPWYQVAEVVEEAGSAAAVADRSYVFYDEGQAVIARLLADRVSEAMVEHWANAIERTLVEYPHTRLLTVLDNDYPQNLRRVYDRPPFLFVRGSRPASRL
jgi:DNA processing protein